MSGGGAGAGPDLAEVYQRLVLDHSRYPRNRGALARSDRAAARDNPLCGDRVSVTLALRGAAGGGGDAEPGQPGAERIAEARFEGVGCAISMASASMMTEAVRGLTPAEAERLAAAFDGLVSGRSPGGALGDLDAFAAVARLPVRARCARLAWQALLDALRSGAAEGAAAAATPSRP